MFQLIVFTSEDMKFAVDFAEFLKKRGFHIYLDKYDPLITNTPDRARRIESQIKSSTDFLVLITENTQVSWWVPFEIGLSTAHDVRIASVLFEDTVRLPSFIKKWPVIDTEEKFYIYLEELEKNKKHLISESISLRKSMAGESCNFSKDNTDLNNMRQSDVFHDVLLRKFGQI